VLVSFCTDVKKDVVFVNVEVKLVSVDFDVWNAVVVERDNVAVDE
jgi:hypothetical protein